MNLGMKLILLDMKLTGYDPPAPRFKEDGGRRIFKWYILWGLSFFESFGGLYLLGGTWHFLAHKL